jgi:hypothetical protein
MKHIMFTPLALAERQQYIGTYWVRQDTAFNKRVARLDGFTKTGICRMTEFALDNISVDHNVWPATKIVKVDFDRTLPSRNERIYLCIANYGNHDLCIAGNDGLTWRQMTTDTFLVINDGWSPFVATNFTQAA